MAFPLRPSDFIQHRIVGGTSSAVPTAWMFQREGQGGPGDPARTALFHQRERGCHRSGESRVRGHLDERLGSPPRAWRTVRSSACSSAGRWSASPCTPTSRWGRGLAPPGARPSIISSPISSVARTPIRRDPCAACIEDSGKRLATGARRPSTTIFASTRQQGEGPMPMTRSVRIHEFGGADVLRIEDVPVGEPGGWRGPSPHSRHRSQPHRGDAALWPLAGEAGLAQQHRL